MYRKLLESCSIEEKNNFANMFVFKINFMQGEKCLVFFLRGTSDLKMQWRRKLQL